MKKEGCKDPKTLPEDIYELLSEDVDHAVSEENVTWAGEAFKDILRSRLLRRDAGSVLRFSSLGKHARQLWYAQHHAGEGEKVSGKQQFKFLYGDVLEVLTLFLAKEAGHEVTHLQHEVNVDGVKGHTDAVIDGVPVDVKSASPFSFQKFKDGGFKFDDPFGYVAQLSGYAHALDNTDRAGFLVVDKVHGGITFAELDKYDILGNPPGERIAELRLALSSDDPPPRCAPDVPDGKSGNRKLSVLCSYCPWKDICWKDANDGRGLRKFLYARGPVWMTSVKNEPKVAEDFGEGK